MTHTDPEWHAREAEASRAKLDLAIDELQGRLTPLGILDEAVGYIRREQPASVIRAAARSVRSNPLPALLIAAGVGLFAGRLLAGRAQSANRPIKGDTT